MNPKAEALKARTKRFALDGIRFVRRSHREFTARIGVVLEEADESELWLELLDESRLGRVSVPGPLLQESRELRSIFSASSLTARRCHSAIR